MADTPSGTVPGEASPSHPNTAWPRFSLSVLYAALMVIAGAGLAYVRLLWEPQMGMSVQNLVSYGIIALAAVLSAIWLVAASPFRRRTVLAIFSVIIVLGAASWASVRDFELTGDMAVVMHYRWEPTAQERLMAHRRDIVPSPDVRAALDVPEIVAEDMPGYRGHDRTGVIIGPPLSQDWESKPPEKLWEQPCGGGYSSFAVVGDSLVTLEQRGPNEAVVCYASSSGAERWVSEYPAAFSETAGGPGPRATPTISDAQVFSLGAEGDLLCLDLATGQTQWHIPVLPEEAKNADWALASSPLVLDGLVIVEAGGPEGDGLVAYDRSTHEVVWKRPGIEQLDGPEIENLAGYSSPMLFQIDGVPQVLMFDGQGLRSHDLTTGQQLWFHEFTNFAGVNVAQPVLIGSNRIFVSQSYGIGCQLLEVSHNDGEWTAQPLWGKNNLAMRCKFASPVLHDGFLYGLDEGILVCLDPETGERRWKGGRYGHGQILLTNGQLVVCTERGDLVLVDPDPERLNEVTRFAALPSRKVWNPFALSRGIVYVRNHENMAAYDLRAP